VLANKAQPAIDSSDTTPHQRDERMSIHRETTKAADEKQPRDWLKLVVDNSRLDEGERFRQQIAGMSDEQLGEWIARQMRRLFQ
jgi:hypothetical protein